MELTGSRTIEADRETVWNALLDRDVLKDCVPGCTEMSGNAEDGFEATVVQKVGPVKATFKGQVTLEDMEKPASLKISGEGKGGAAGFASGGAKVKLREEGGATVLDYDVEAKVGGKIAQLGSRIIDSFAKKMADQFFTDFKDAVEGPGDDAEATGPNAASDDAAAPAEAKKEKKGWFAKLKSS
ncbi:carbon monoxide dehydrogenase subunit G [Maribius pontilimi]|uniref:Carbon monoxide dehydrogenase subunit G n=1 Tax=Palleronia pontilimi TaxID=1964209 RepID=A0A934IE06_9RHOB|nr:carbon monoxide dehydrogenase subunit G [Palleronia pontilimi]MBJ3761740.1 carbon monoxide dehydrogenase subunit G [Palleronia pontilimi]